MDFEVVFFFASNSLPSDSLFSKAAFTNRTRGRQDSFFLSSFPSWTPSPRVLHRSTDTLLFRPLSCKIILESTYSKDQLQIYYYLLSLSGTGIFLHSLKLLWNKIVLLLFPPSSVFSFSEQGWLHNTYNSQRLTGRLGLRTPKNLAQIKASRLVRGLEKSTWTK